MKLQQKISTEINKSFVGQTLPCIIESFTDFCERIADKTIRDCFIEKPIQQNEKVLVIIGPEGGFSQKEFDYFRSKNLPLLSLGDLILKAETAVIVTLGDIVYEYQG